MKKLARSLPGILNYSDSFYFYYHFRANALLNSGAMSWEERPIWFDVYEAFPPKDEPTFGRSAPNMHLKKIFYEEDKIRAYVFMLTYCRYVTKCFLGYSTKTISRLV